MMSIGYVPKVPASRRKIPNGTRMRKNEKKKPGLDWGKKSARNDETKSRKIKGVNERF
jgi:hypothetical protein